MLDDRMQHENLKSVAASLMQQSVPAGVTGSGDGDSTYHEDAGFARGLFGESDDVYESPPKAAVSSGLNLSALSRRGPRQQVRTALAETAVDRPRRKGLREDLVQQAAQSLVKDQIDAYLAITGKMSPDEIVMSLQTARQWRRSEDGWQDDFRQAPETGFGFIDRKPPNGGQPKKERKRIQSGQGMHRPNKAEALALEIADMIRGSRTPMEETPRVVRTVLNERGIRLPPKMLAAFSAKVFKLVGG